MLGIIGFKGYKVRCIIGTESWERKEIQEIFIDLKVEADISRVAQSDDLHDTVDYVSLAAICRKMAEEGQYLLIEKYAADVLEKLPQQFAIHSAWICVKKPQAIPFAECALVELKREYKR